MEFSKDDDGRSVAKPCAGDGAAPRVGGATPRGTGMGLPQKATRGTGGAGLGRRAFLAGLVAGLGLLAAGRARARRPGNETADAWAWLLRAPESAAAIGARYLDEHPEERTAALRLARRIAERSSRSAMRRALQLESTRDFAEGRVVGVAGWILSRTEARLCAAVRLGASG